jgi:hypothetical protein
VRIELGEVEFTGEQEDDGTNGGEAAVICPASRTFMPVNVFPGEGLLQLLIRPILDRVGFYRWPIEPYPERANVSETSFDRSGREFVRAS